MRIPSKRLSGTFYHGTSISKNDELPNLLSLDYSDYEAIWFTSDEMIAQQYADRWNDFEDEDYNFVVFELKINTSKIANLQNYEFVQFLLQKFDLEDARDLIPILKEKGFNGWEVTGSIGQEIYDDYCIFYEDLINIIGVSIYDKTINDWTDFMSIEKAQEKYFLNEHKISFIKNIIKESEENVDDFFKPKNLKSREEKRLKEYQVSLFKVKTGLSKIKYDYENENYHSEHEELFLNIFSKLHVHEDIRYYERYAGCLLMNNKNEARCLFDFEYHIFYILFEHIWLAFRDKFNWDYDHIKKFLKEMLNSYFQDQELTIRLPTSLRFLENE